jgi:NAD-dependent SIR2 family protein deacetylase
VPNVVEISKDLARGKFPACPHCGEIARPNISWGDSSFVHAEGDERARLFTSSVDAMKGSTLVIECGASPGSGLRRFAEDLHRQREEIFLIRINLDAQEIAGERHLSVAASAENALVGLRDAVLFER